MRRVLTFFFVFLPLLASAQRIDFVAKGEPLEFALERLSKATGLDLSVSQELASEIVVIDVTQRDLQELLDRIAQVTSAEWKRTSTRGQRLERDSQLQRKLREASVAVRAAGVTKYLEQFDKALASPFAGEEAVALRQEIESLERSSTGPLESYAQIDMYNAWAKGPKARLANRLLKSIDPVLLVDIEYGERRVFNLTPTSLQHGFGEGAKEAFETYVEEQNVWAAAVAGSTAQLLYISNPLMRSETVLAPPYDWSIVVQSPDDGGMTLFAASLVALLPDAPADPLYSAQAPDSRLIELMPVFMTPLTVPDDLTGIARDIALATRAMRTRQPFILSEEARRFAMKPTEGDTGGLIAHYVLKKRHPEKDFVVVLPDTALYIVGYLLTSIDSPELIDRAMTDGMNLKSEIEGGWFLLSPDDPYIATHERTPRKPLEKYLRDTEEAGYMSLLNYSELAANTSRPSMAAEFLSRILGIGLAGMSSVETSWNIVKLYGLLVPAQRTALAQGGKLKLANLSRDQRTAFQRLALSQMISRREPMPDGQGYSTIGQSVEPTEWLANGLLGSAELTMDVKEDPYVYGYHKVEDGFKAINGYSTQTVAGYERARRNPSASSGRMIIPDAWAIGSRRTIDFRLQFSEETYERFRLTEDWVNPDAKPGSWESLPKEIVEQIRKLMGGLRSAGVLARIPDHGRPARFFRGL